MALLDPAVPVGFLRTAFEPDDWIAVFLKSYATGETAQRVVPLEAACSPRFQAWLRFKNARRFNVYVSVNALLPGRSRTRQAIATVRHVFLEEDRDGDRLLDDLARRSELPRASYVLQTSPGRVHVLWRARGFDAGDVEGLQRYLARELRTDVAATSCTQTTRVPSFLNYKHERPSLVTVSYLAPSIVSTPSDFPRLAVNGAPARPAIRLVTIARQVRPDPRERAARYLRTVDAARAGCHGDARTFRVCCRLARGFGLSDEEAMDVLREWNARCEPPWSERELLQKLANARRYGSEPIGRLL